MALHRATARPSDTQLQAWAHARSLRLTPENTPLVVWYLCNASMLRTTGAVAGVVVPSLVKLAWSGRASVVGIFVGGDMQPGDVSWIFVGYLVGALYAELALVRPIDRSHPVASLVPRQVGDYLPLRLLWAQRAAGVAAAVGALAMGAASFKEGFSEPSWAAAGFFAAFCVAFTGVLEVLQGWVVRRPQPYTSPELVAADDALRSQAVHSLAGAGLAWLLLSCAGIAPVLAAAGGSLVAWTMGVAGLVLLVTALACCQYLTARPWRVRRGSPNGPSGVPA